MGDGAFRLRRRDVAHIRRDHFSAIAVRSDHSSCRPSGATGRNEFSWCGSGRHVGIHGWKFCLVRSGAAIWGRSLPAIGRAAWPLANRRLDRNRASPAIFYTTWCCFRFCGADITGHQDICVCSGWSIADAIMAISRLVHFGHIYLDGGACLFGVGIGLPIPRNRTDNRTAHANHGRAPPLLVSLALNCLFFKIDFQRIGRSFF